MKKKKRDKNKRIEVANYNLCCTMEELFIEKMNLVRAQEM